MKPSRISCKISLWLNSEARAQVVAEVLRQEIPCGVGALVMKIFVDTLRPRSRVLHREVEVTQVQHLRVIELVAPGLESGMRREPQTEALLSENQASGLQELWSWHRPRGVRPTILRPLPDRSTGALWHGGSTGALGHLWQGLACVGTC